MALQCRICGNTEKNRLHRAREMMFGTREEFDYVECGACGTVQIADIPDLSKHYPKNYYSFDPAPTSGFRVKLSRLLLSAYLKNAKRPIRSSPLASKITGRLDRVEFEARFMDLGSGAISALRSEIQIHSRILDVGCGEGSLLNTLNYLGFRSLTGIDAFIERDRILPNGIRILKRSLDKVEGKFDLIMFHHSLEHMPDPLATLQTAMQCLSKNGTCLVRIPIANLAWQTYGVNWVALDPPRHLHLFSEHSFRMTVEKAGFAVEKVIYDSTSFQFSGSERYSCDIPLFGDHPDAPIFSAKQIKEWRRIAAKINIEGKGDQAAFYLKRR